MRSKPNKSLVALTSAVSAVLGVSLGTSSAQELQNPVEMQFSTNRSYRQIGNDVIFLQGNMGLNFRDGYFTYDAGCPLNGSLIWYPPMSPIPPCPLGATGVVLSGDLDGDGLRDDNTYWSMISVTPAQLVQPSRPDLVKFFAGPPSTLPRTLGPFSDARGVEIFFNLLTPSVRQSSITRYNLIRNYAFGERTRMDSDLPSGLYQFTFPRLNFPLSPVGLQVTHAPIPEGRRKYGSVWQGFRFLGLKYAPDGFAEIDPRIINIIRWEGTSGNIYPAADRFFFSIRQQTDPGNPLGAGGLSIFPPQGPPNVDPRVLLPSPLDTSYIVPPYLATTPIGTEAVIRLTLSRNLLSTIITYDQSTRTFEIPVRFVNTYAGWAILNFPPGSNSSVTGPTANPDGDAFTNFEEWLNGTDPMVADAPPAPAGLRFVQSSKKNAVGSDSYWMISFPKLANHESALSYAVEFSDGDLGVWREITETDANWEVKMSESSTEIVVKSKSPELSGKGFFRVKTTHPSLGAP